MEEGYDYEASAVERAEFYYGWKDLDPLTRQYLGLRMRFERSVEEETEPEFQARLAQERARYGYCTVDFIYGLYPWFHTLIPKMIEEYRSTKQWYPSPMLDLYYRRHRRRLKGITLDRFCESYYTKHDCPQVNEDEVDAWCFARWNDILQRIIDLCHDSLRETCSFQDEFDALDAQEPKTNGEYARWRAQLGALDARLARNSEKAIRLFGKWVQWIDC